MSEVAKIDDQDSANWNVVVDESPQGIFYAKSWWLGAVAQGRHEPLTVGKGNDIRAGWPIDWRELPANQAARQARCASCTVIYREAGRHFVATRDGRIHLTRRFSLITLAQKILS